MAPRAHRGLHRRRRPRRLRCPDVARRRRDPRDPGGAVDRRARRAPGPRARPAAADAGARGHQHGTGRARDRRGPRDRDRGRREHRGSPAAGGGGRRGPGRADHPPARQRRGRVRRDAVDHGERPGHRARGLARDPARAALHALHDPVRRPPPRAGDPERHVRADAGARPGARGDAARRAGDRQEPGRRRVPRRRAGRGAGAHRPSGPVRGAGRVRPARPHDRARAGRRRRGARGRGARAAPPGGARVGRGG